MEGARALFLLIFFYAAFGRHSRFFGASVAAVGATPTSQAIPPLFARRRPLPLQYPTRPKGPIFFSARLPMKANKALFPLAALALLCAVFLVYRPGLTGGFWFDDMLSVADNQLIRIHSLDPTSLWRAALSGNAGPLGRPLAMLSFALDYYYSGLDPAAFKLTNIVIHLVNAVAVYFLGYLILTAYRRRFRPELTAGYLKWLALAAAGAWALHPLDVTAVLYVVQRMTSLAATFTLAGLICYLWGRLRQLEGKSGLPHILVGLCGFGPLALLAKENGALLPLYMLVLEWVLFRFEAPDRASRRVLYGLFGLTVLLPGLLAAAYLASGPEWFELAYRGRDFDLPQRLMTEARVLWLYLSLAVFPDPARLGLFHDDFVVSRTLFSPPDTLPAMLGIGGLLAAGLWSRRRAPLLALGLLWFLAGQSMESTVIPLELVFEHRNYLPLYGILLAGLYYLTSPSYLKASYNWRWAAAVLCICALGAVTAFRADEYGNPDGFQAAEALRHPRSPRANYAAGRQCLIRMQRDKAQREACYRRARFFFERANAADADYSAGYVGLLYLARAAHRPIEPQWLDALARRLGHPPFAADNVGLLAGIAAGGADNPAGLAPRQVVRLFAAALGNPSLAGRHRGMVEMALAGYYASLRDYGDAVAWARRAARTAPGEALFNYDLAMILIEAGDREGARAQLLLARRHDRLGLYRAQIDGRLAALARGPEKKDIPK